MSEKDLRHYGASNTADMPTYTGEQKPQCRVCCKQFSFYSSLVRHLVTHTGETPYSCSFCGKAFSQSGTLKTHMRTHTPVKRFPCSACGQRFSHSNTLKTHMRTHTGEQPFECSKCGRRFSHSSSLKGHMRKHTGEKPFQCSFCKKLFAHYSSIIHHRKTHHRQIKAMEPLPGTLKSNVTLTKAVDDFMKPLPLDIELSTENGQLNDDTHPRKTPHRKLKETAPLHGTWKSDSTVTKEWDDFMKQLPLDIDFYIENCQLNDITI